MLVCGTALATGPCPEFSGCTWCSGFSASLAEWKLTLQRCLWASLCTIFSKRSGDSMNANAIPCCRAEPALLFKVYWHGSCSGQTWQYCLSDELAAEARELCSALSRRLQTARLLCLCCNESELEMTCS